METAKKKPTKSMAELFVKYYGEWMNDDSVYANRTDLSAYLHQRDLIGDGQSQICFMQFWNTKPLNDNGAVATSISCSYAVMDFTDGSIAIRRNFGERFDGEASDWLVAL